MLAHTVERETKMWTAWNKHSEVFLTPDLSLGSLYLHWAPCIYTLVPIQAWKATESVVICVVEVFYSSGCGLQDHSVRSVPCNRKWYFLFSLTWFKKQTQNPTAKPENHL